MKQTLMAISLMSLAFAASVSAQDDFKACTLHFVAQNCAFAGEESLSLTKQREGAASCLVAQKIVPREMQTIRDYLDNVIEDKALRESDYQQEIAMIDRCLLNAANFANCRLETFASRNARDAGPLCD